MRLTKICNGIFGLCGTPQVADLKLSGCNDGSSGQVLVASMVGACNWMLITVRWYIVANFVGVWWF